MSITQDVSAQRPWQRVDLSRVLNGSYTPPTPTVGERDDGVGLFYRGRQHSVAGESESGKTWLMLAQAEVELRRGNAVIYVDYEDDEGGVVGRLLALQASHDAVRDRFAYLRPDQPIGALGNHLDLTEALGDLRPTLAVIDGVTEAMVLHGLNPLDNKDAAKFGRLVPAVIAAHGPATVSLDHLPKSTENRGRYAIGAAHKLNGLNGSALMVDARTPFGVGLTGRARVLVSKDRPGQVRRHGLRSSAGQTWLGDFVLTSHADMFVEANLTAPVARSDFRPTVLMGRIAAALTTHGPLSQRKILALVKGNRGQAIEALVFLQIDGYVSDETPHKLLKPYPSASPAP